ncbi:uncharacterized protein TNCV_1355801 [Trichonephila clavipes]|uniref:Uncharacterized protein n=1 Tax=Trichonephila clavipes TaxID=2585209 RepID=A0A8X6V7W1_TRICX|nr:uncharacterized protein TNCV_1355801 [Trichonephila clavipes]
MATSSSSFLPTPLTHANLGEGHPKGAPLQRRPTKFNLYKPEVRGANGFSVLPEVFFSGSENVTELVEDTDNQIRLLEITSDLSCAPREGPRLVSDIRVNISAATDFAQLKMAKAFPAIRNNEDLEIRFYSSQQRRDQ